MSNSLYKDRQSITVYLTKDGLMEETKEYCRRYGYSLSKLAQAALAEKMERERERGVELIAR
jgi:hypothetical protein